jgi:hypothetical protein
MSTSSNDLENLLRDMEASKSEGSNGNRAAEQARVVFAEIDRVRSSWRDAYCAQGFSDDEFLWAWPMIFSEVCILSTKYCRDHVRQQLLNINSFVDLVTSDN